MITATLFPRGKVTAAAMSAAPNRVRRFVEAETGERRELIEVEGDDDRRPTYNFPGGFSAVSNRVGLAVLNKESGLTPCDRDVLALHVHGPEKRGDVLRWSREAMADFIGKKTRSVSASIRKLVKAGLLFEAEKHGRTTYYRTTPHHASRAGGEQQREDAAAYRLPVVPGLPDRKESA
ncbi:winged helix-turn-helix domain-containing protein [Streptomyces sp. NPDC014733]|uniref:helix-turn-helix domain-containing protein n=1 Tax=Streptomyces sp. NPDC014733 TaxID=3364885 RepID=UPI0036FD7F62